MAITKITSGVLSDGAIDNSKIAANTITTSQLHSTFTLDGVTEGASELYFTTVRARASVSAGGDLSYNSSTGVVSYTTPTTIASIANHDTADLAEGTNLYYTDARADARTQGKSLIPTANNTYSLGNSSMQWHSLYVGPGSLYIAGKKVIEDNSDTITISTDINQDLRVQTSGSGNIELLTGASGLIEAKSTLQLLTGKRITDSAGTNVELGDPIHMNSNKITNLGTPSASTDAATKAYADTKAPLASPTLTGVPLAPTAANTVNNTQIATTNFVTNKITNLIGGAPGTLDTLNELAAAINDDSNYNSTLTTALATKAPLASPTFTGTVSSGTITSTGIITSAEFFKATGQNIKFSAGGTHVLNMDVNRKIYPATHNSTDLGHSGTLGFRNLYLSGSVYHTTSQILDTSRNLSNIGTISSGDITINGQSSGVEGGQINLLGAAALEDIHLDNYNGTFRIFDGSVPQVRLSLDTSGNATFAGGITAGPAGINTQDHRVPTGTGYITYSPANQTADVLNIRRYATVQQKFDQYGVHFPSGNVGIGTTSPDYQLDIENTSGNAMARLHSGTNGSSSLRLQNDAQHFDVNLQTNDKFAIYDHTAGTQPFTIMPTTGNVGIGTSDPAALLHLKSTVNSTGPSLIFENTNNAQTMNIDYWNNGGAVQSRIQYAEGPAAWYFQPNVSSGDSALTIHYDATVDAGGTPTGSVRTHGVVVSDDHRNGLLGTTLGDTQRVFGIHSKSQNQDYLTFRTRRITDSQSGWNHAVWDITRDIDNTSDLYRYITFGIGDVVINEFGANMDFRVESDSNANMLWVNGGTNKVGIGTGVADETLSVNGGLKIGGSNSRLYFGTVGSTSRRALEGSTDGALLQVGETYTDSALQGNVGIGTVGPEQLLQVKEGSTSTSQVHLPLAVGGSSHVAAYTVGIALDPEGYGYRNKMAIVAEGNNQGWSRGKLHFLMRNDSTTTNVTLADSKVTLLEDGNFGIGTNNPLNKLDVNGGATIRDALRVGTDSNDPGEIYIADASTTAYTLGIIGTGTRTFEFRGSSSGADYNSYFTNPSTGKHNLHVNGYVSIEAGQRLYLDGSGDTYFLEYSANEIGVYTGGTVRAKWSGGNYLPGADNAYDLGSSSTRWRNLYTTDLHLSNEGKPEGNQVDGTTGNWTIQEGEENLYIINNKSGKKYKFALEEIT